MFYKFSDEEVQVIYSDILKKGDSLISDDSLPQEIALLMAQVNRLMNVNPEYITTHELNIGHAARETLKLKANLIREYRIQRDRERKLDLMARKLTALTNQDFKDYIGKLAFILQDYLDRDQAIEVLSKLTSFDMD